MDFSQRIPTLQDRVREGHRLLRRSRTAIATADRVLLTSWVSLFEGLGPLVTAATSEEECLQSLGSSEADLLLCTDLLEAGSGVSLVRRARAAYPQLKILMLIQRPIVRTILEAIDAGSDGLCAHQNAGSGTVLAALNAIESDEQYIDPMISGVLRHGRLGKGSDQGPLAELSLREEDVLRGLCRGMSNREIADALVVSIDTVKSHVGSVLRKLPAKDRTHAVVMAFRDGLVELPARPPRWQGPRESG